MSAKFNVIFQGELVTGRALAEVKTGVAQLFSTDSARIEQLFSGKSFVIKSGVDQPTAVKYQQAMAKAGAICQVVSSSRAEATDHEDQQGEGLDGVSIAPPGALITTSPQPRALAIDTSMLSMAPAGADILDAKAGDSMPLSISGDFSIAPPGAIMDPRPLAESAAVPDTSEITLAPVGSDIDGGKEAAPMPAPPDTRGLSIVPKESSR